MKTALYNNLVKVTLVARNPVALLKRLQRGDVDDGSSTMRTAAVVAIVMVIFAGIAFAIHELACSADPVSCAR